MSRRWLVVIMMTTTVCLGGTVVPPVEAASPVAVAVNPKATYLRTDPTDAAAMNAVPIDLGALGFLPGMTIQLSVIGEYRAAAADTDRRSELVAVFSNGPTLLARNQSNRVPGALETGFDVKTLVTFPGRLATDLRQDFLVTPTIRVKIPVGASHLFVSPDDDFFGDNSDDNGNFALHCRNRRHADRRCLRRTDDRAHHVARRRRLRGFEDCEHEHIAGHQIRETRHESDLLRIDALG